MHVLPLPFGLALALMQRREADQIRKPKPVVIPFREPVTRELPADIRYAELRRAI
jgi:hypothetical protein